MIEIPKQLQNKDFRFCLIRKQSKAPFEKDWANKGYSFDNPKLLEHLKKGGNYGVIGGYGNLRIIDIDDETKVEEFKEKFKDTFVVKTGSEKIHSFILSDYSENKVFANGLGEMRANNYQVVGCGSTHPNGNKYEILFDNPIKEYSKEEIKEILKPYLREEQTPTTTPTEPKKEDTSRSGKEFRQISLLLKKGKTRAEIYEEMKLYSKWVNSPEAYRTLTYEKAEDLFLKREEEKEQKKIKNIPKELTPTEESLEILNNPKLFENIIKELDKKIEGEQKSKKAITLSLCSVWVDGSEVPLNTLVSSESSAGKSFICKRIIKLFPKEMVVYRTKITPEAFTYWKSEEDWDWDGKICYLEDISQGILDAPTFKVMCSEGSTATIVIKQKAVDIDIKGKPVMLITTARTSPNTEILNRFQIVSLDESKEQTEKIIFRQAKQSNGENYNQNIVNALGLLKRKSVFIPYAEQIAEYIKKSFNFNSLRLRRDFSRLLDLIKCSAVLHQYQREINENGELIAKEQDYFIARECINYIQTQTFKGLTHKLKKAFDCCKEFENSNPKLKLNENKEVEQVGFTAKDIHNKYPFVNQKMWYNYLDGLCERGMLTTELKKIEESKSRVTFYKINEDMSFSLPDFNLLPEFITNDTKLTINTINTNVTNVKEEKGNDCKECNDCFDKSYSKISKFTDSQIKECGYTREDLEEVMKDD